jgi:hypothetical protein
MAIPKKLAKRHRLICYVDQIEKFQIALEMKKRNISSFSQFLRLATFFLINKIGFTQSTQNEWSDWKQEKQHLKTIGVDIKKINDYKKVIEEIKKVIKKID